MEAIIPKCLDDNATDLFIYPYLILEIEEFGSIYEGTNNITNRAFARLNFDKIVGNYRYFKPDQNNKIIKFFNPRIALNRITIKLTKPDGSLINFGNSIKLETLCNESVSFNIRENKKIYDLSNGENIKFPEDLDIDDTNNIIEEISSSQSTKKNTITEEEGAIFNSFIFKITCIQRSLDTMYLDKRDG